MAGQLKSFQNTFVAKLLFFGVAKLFLVQLFPHSISVTRLGDF